MISLLSKLIEIDSVSGNEIELVKFLRSELEQHFGAAAVATDDRNVIVSLGPSSSDTTLLLCSHIDTVPPCPGWTREPFSAGVENDRVYGLGANDALGSVVSMIEAAKNCHSALQQRLILCFVCEEEQGSQGFYRLQQQLPHYDYAIFGEPTQMNIAYCMRGFMKLKMLSRGKSCHASRPHQGLNAIFALEQDLKTLRRLPLADSSVFETATVQPTIVSGGSSSNQIPNLVETILDVRPTAEHNNECILAMLTEAKIEFEVIANRRKPIESDPNSAFVTKLRGAHSAGELIAFQGTCDMAFSEAPAVVIGAGKSERSHSADEFVEIAELQHAAKTYEQIVRTLLC